MNPEILLADFCDFVSVSPDSAKSYVSYLSNACKHFFDEVFEKDFGDSTLNLICSSSDESRQFIATKMLVILNDEYKKDRGIVKKKTISNYRSAVLAFQVFLDEINDQNSPYYQKYSGGKNLLNKPQAASSFNIYYTQKDILKNFKFRIDTQDRFYPKEKVCFPCRLFSRIFSKNDNYKKYVIEMLNRCKILISKDKNTYITLDKISGIEITNQGYRLDILHNQAGAYIFSEIYKQKKLIGVQQITGQLRDLSLDHDKPLYEIIPDFVFGESPIEYKKISDAFSRFWEENQALPAEKRLKKSKLTTRFYDEEYQKLDINESALLIELKSLFEIINLTLMDKASNSSKNKNLVVGNAL